MIVGYARVSTDGQTLDAQQATLTAAGAGKVFAEKTSGSVTDRKALAKAMAALGPGDVLLESPDGAFAGSASGADCGKEGPIAMTGPIGRRGKQSWELKFEIGRNAKSERITQYHSVKGTKKAAEFKLAELIAAVGKGA